MGLTRNNTRLAIKESCTGCGICASICPHGCIRMVEGIHGHLFPIVDENACKRCGLCDKCCSVLHPCELKPINQVYASWTKDSRDYRTTASGGIATVLSRFVIGQRGVVYGCAMLPDAEVKHIRVDKVEGLDLLKSSKYVQSYLIEIIPQLVMDVSDGKLVLFIGTPCQVGAVKNLFRVQPDNLLLVDLICHGVPSLKTLKEHVRRVAPKYEIGKVTFRENGNCFALTIYDVSGKQVYRMPLWEERYKDWYMNTFIDGYTYRDCCYTCRYATHKRVSDITIGDFWGLCDTKNEIPNHEYGCSVVMPITPKGMAYFDKIRPFINTYERDIQEAVAGNSQLRQPTKLTKRIRYYRKVQNVVKWPRLYYWVNLDRMMKKKF